MKITLGALIKKPITKMFSLYSYIFFFYSTLIVVSILYALVSM